MPTQVRLLDARGVEVSGPTTYDVLLTATSGAQTTSHTEHQAPAPYPLSLPDNKEWRRAKVTISHGDYLPLEIQLEPSGAMVSCSDAAAGFRQQGGDVVIDVPLGRVRFAPGQLPSISGPNGSERGVFLTQQPNMPQRYGGINFQMEPSPPLRILSDATVYGTSITTCLVNNITDDGWARLSTSDPGSVEPRAKGGFVWLEYGSPDTRPTQPRFLIAMFVPDADAVKRHAIDALVFFSPTTATDPYFPSTYPFRDKYPYAAFGRETIDPETKVKHAANVQPYIHLGLKYLFKPSHLVAMTLASKKPLLVVMPIFPRVTGPTAGRQMWQPFNSQAGIWRLLSEIRLFLQRENYEVGYLKQRLNGIVAASPGTPEPPRPPTFSAKDRDQLQIGDIVLAGYSSGSTALYRIFRDRDITGSASDFPPALFGADPAEFDRRWKQFWALDLFLDPKKTGINRNEYEQTLRSWLSAGGGNRVLRIYHSGWTLNADPDAFLPQLRRQLTTAPRRIVDPKLASRWATDWRDPSGRWSAVFLSGPWLRAKTADKVAPPFPISEPDGSKGDPAGLIHPFAMELGLGHAASLR